MRYKVGDKVVTNLKSSVLNGREGEIVSVHPGREDDMVHVFQYYVRINDEPSRYPVPLGFDENELDPIVPAAPVESEEGPVGRVVLSKADKELVEKVLTEKVRGLHSEIKRMGLPEEAQDFQSLTSQMVAILDLLDRLRGEKFS